MSSPYNCSHLTQCNWFVSDWTIQYLQYNTIFTSLHTKCLEIIFIYCSREAAFLKLGFLASGHASFLKISSFRAPERPMAYCFQPRPSWTTLLTRCTCYTPLCFDVWLRCCQQFVYRSAVLLYTTTMYNWTIPITWQPFCNAHTLLRPNKKKTRMGNCIAVLCFTALYNCSLPGASLA